MVYYQSNVPNYNQQHNSHNYRGKRHKHSYRHGNNNIFSNKNNKNKNQTRSAFIIGTRSNQQHVRHNLYTNNNNNFMSANAKRIHKTQAARNLSGLNENSSPQLVQKSINDISKLLQNNPTSAVMVELFNIEQFYTNCLSKSKQNQQTIQYQKQQREININKIIPNNNHNVISIKNNPTGIIIETFQWIQLKNNIKYIFPQNEANKIENKYCSGHKKGNNYSRNNYYEIIFNKTGIIQIQKHKDGINWINVKMQWNIIQLLY